MSTVRRCIGAAAVALAGGALAAAPASALEPGVHVDPGSPAAKEYAIPLGQARQLGGVESYSSSSETKLFGAGIKRPPGGSSGTRARGHRRDGAGSGGAVGSGTGGGGGSPGGTGASAESTAAGAQLPSSVLRAVHEHASGDSSLLVLIGGGVAILVLGAFGGTVLRHRRPHPTP
jgi:hypothetical protein